MKFFAPVTLKPSVLHNYHFGGQAKLRVHLVQGQPDQAEQPRQIQRASNQTLLEPCRGNPRLIELAWAGRTETQPNHACLAGLSRAETERNWPEPSPWRLICPVSVVILSEHDFNIGFWAHL